MRLLENTVQEYAWGSRTAIAELLGARSPSERPQAELWMGAHPAAPSRVQEVGGARSLLSVLEANAEEALGPALAARYGGRLPFLLKVLAAQTPLSLQAHPNESQAREGFDRENQAGVPLKSPKRNYKDPNHKPELLCALTPFEALCGFRAADETLRLLQALAIPALEPALQTLRATPDRRGLRTVFEGLMRLPSAAQAEVAATAVDACRTHAAARGPFARECAWAAALGELYPGDVGAVSALLLNLVHLEPGEAIYLPAGNLHAYLRGVGVEVMASSDNVLRGGLTPKHVDVPELLRVLDFQDGPVTPLTPEPIGPHERAYRTGAPEFRLSHIELKGSETCTPARRGPEILLCTEGSLEAVGEAGRLSLRKGASAFVAASEPPYALRGAGVLFRATAGE